MGLLDSWEEQFDEAETGADDATPLADAEDPIAHAANDNDDGFYFNAAVDSEAIDDYHSSDDDVTEAATSGNYEPAAFDPASAEAPHRPDPVEAAATPQSHNVATLPDTPMVSQQRADTLNLASQTDRMPAPDLPLAEILREQQNKKEMTAEPQMVTIAPGTQFEIVGLGLVEVQQGRSDMETA